MDCIDRMGELISQIWQDSLAWIVQLGTRIDDIARRHPRFKRVCMKWRILTWKAVLMRRHSPIITALEIIVAFIFILQIRLMFQPQVLHPEDLDTYTRADILKKLPTDVHCWYAPKSAFVDELMLKAAKMLDTNIQAAESEISLVHTRYKNNDTSKVLWAIFDESATGKPKVLNYKIRSSEIAKERMILMHEEEPSHKDPYILTGFMALQMAIEKSYVDMWINPALPVMADNLSIGRFPLYKGDFLVLPYMIRPNISVLYYIMVIAFLLLPIEVLRKALHDKEIGFRGLMKLTDMSFPILYIGWIIYLLFTLVPVAILFMILLSPVFFMHWFITFIFIIMYVIISTLFMFTISTFFHHATKALLVSLMIWIFLAHFTIVLDQFLMAESKLFRIGLLVLPHNGLIYGLVALSSRPDIGDFENEGLKSLLEKMKIRNYNFNLTSYLWPRWFSESIVLRNAYEIMHAKEKISIETVLFAWLLHIIFWYLLAVYCDNLRPGRHGKKEPWYYVCKTPVTKENELTLLGSTNWSAVERTSPYLKPSIRVRCATKEFGRFGQHVTAVDNITINFYQKELTVILGHNGSGKSCLLKLIIGMYRPTRGNVYLESINNRTHVEPIGYCSDENILVNYLTTMEHMYIIGMIKGMTYQDAYRESMKLLKRLDLESVRDKKIKTFSFSVKRRICLGMALIGDAKILVLDEPTQGIESAHRRLVWDLLSDIKSTKTILMATNSIEAADILADRIAIIVNGRIECYGSKMYLNHRYDIGYILSLLVLEDCNVDDIQKKIQEFSVDPVILRSTMGRVIRFDVPRRSRFTQLLEHLEMNKDELKIVSATLSAASIESHFLRIGLESQFRERRGILTDSKYELIVQHRRERMLKEAEPWERLTGDALWRQQVVAMLFKKLLHIVSSWKLYTLTVILAIITFILATIIGELTSFTFFDTSEKIMNLTGYINDNNFHVLFYADDKPAKDFLVALYTTSEIYSERHNYHISTNITAMNLLVHPDLHSIEFRDHYVMSVDIHEQGYVQLLYSSTAVHSGPMALNLLHNGLLRYHTGSADHQIKLISRPLMELGQWEHLLIHPRSVRNWENAVLLITLFLVLPSIDMGIREKQTLSKMLQTNAMGMSTKIYRISMYIIDFLLYTFFVVIFGIAVLLVYHRSLTVSGVEIVQVLIMFLCYGACAIPLGYCVQLITTKPENAYLVVIVINIIIVFLVNSTTIFPLVYQVFSKTGIYLFEVFLHILPPYVLACALSNYITLKLFNRHCSHFHVCDTEFYIEDPCCQNETNEYSHKQIDIMYIKQSGQEFYHAIIDDILLMVAQVIAFYIILEIFEEKNRRKFFDTLFPVENDNVTNPDIMEEKKNVEQHMKHYDETKTLPPHVALVVHNLRKEYEGRAVLQGVSFNVYNEDCFGLLGLNGSGKSTIYKILTGEIRMTAGRAVIYGYDIVEDQEQFIGMIGYCPQNDGLSDFMTPRKYLLLHAALRGVPYKHLEDEVNKWLDILDMLDFENLKLSNCPWAVQRKICVLQSLIGNLPMVFMDDPTAGFDLISRHALCEILYHARDLGRSMMITTQSIEDAEAMCLRIGILVNGQFVTIGSCEQLKAKYGRNFILSIKVVPAFQIDLYDTIREIIEETFPMITFKESYLGILKYELETDVSHSYIFENLSKLRQRYVWLTDFYINQPSMDEIFVSLVKEQEEPPEKVTFWEKLVSAIYERIRTCMTYLYQIYTSYRTS